MATGQRTTYTDSDIAKRGIADLIQLIDWTQAPLLRLLGCNNESRFRIVNWPRTKIEWMEDDMSPRSGTINEALDNSETGVDLASGEGDYLKEGDVILIDSEQMYVSAVSSDTLTVTRGWGSTSAATHNTSTAWELVTTARLEGADYDTGHTTTISLPYNHTQILSEAVKVTGSEEVNNEYGISDQMAYHIAKLIGGGEGIGTRGKAGKLAILLQKTFYHGQRNAGTSSTSRSMGGFNTYVTTNVTDKSSAALTRKNIEDTMEDCFLAGGMPDCIVTNSWGMRKITSFYEGLISVDRDEARGGSKITTVVTDFGDMEVIHDRWCPQDEMYVIEKDKMGWLEYRPFDIFDRASTGDYMVKDVLGEYSFILVNEEAHGRIHSFSTTK